MWNTRGAHDTYPHLTSTIQNMYSSFHLIDFQAKEIGLVYVCVFVGIKIGPLCEIYIVVSVGLERILFDKICTCISIY